MRRSRTIQYATVLVVLIFVLLFNHHPPTHTLVSQLLEYTTESYNALFEKSVRIYGDDYISLKYDRLRWEDVLSTQQPGFNLNNYAPDLPTYQKNLLHFYSQQELNSFERFKNSTLSAIYKITKDRKLSLEVDVPHIDHNNLLSLEYLTSIDPIDPYQFEVLQNHSNYLLTELQQVPYPPYNDKGIVIIDNNHFQTYIIFKKLRKMTPELKIEIINVSPYDYNLKYCQYYQANHGKCLILSEYFTDDELLDTSITSLAMLISSFERIVLLDSSTIILKDPTFLLEREPFNSPGLVLWPFVSQNRHSSPTSYKLFNFDYGTDRRRDGVNPYLAWEGQPKSDEPFPFDDMDKTIPNPLSDSSMLVINKNSHFRPLILSYLISYYTAYHNIIDVSQLTIFSSHILNMPYYQVKKTPQFFVNEISENLVDNGAMLVSQFAGLYGVAQYDPFDDYIIYEAIIMKINEAIKTGKQIKIENVNDKDLHWKNYKLSSTKLSVVAATIFTDLSSDVHAKVSDKLTKPLHAPDAFFEKELYDLILEGCKFDGEIEVCEFWEKYHQFLSEQAQ